jgi:hypothetical protein
MVVQVDVAWLFVEVHGREQDVCDTGVFLQQW